MASLKLATKTLTGSLNQLNKNVCDWGWQGLVAYGCQNFVVVIDPSIPQIIQTFDGHKASVVKVKWAKENYHHDLSNPYSLRLASADYNGKIIVWNPCQASILAEFSDSVRPVSDMEWLTSQDASRDLLAVLHPSYSLVLWNADTGIKLWKKSYTENVLSFAFDPFDPCKMAFLGVDSIIFVDDFSQFKTTSSNGRKYYISSPTVPVPGGVSGGSGDTTERRTSKTAMQFVSSMLVGGDSARRVPAEEAGLRECIQLLYHQSFRNHIILVYPREILILDLEINQTVGVVTMERSGSPFLQVHSLKQQNVLLCLHENGSVSVRTMSKPSANSPRVDFSDDLSSQTSVSYSTKCQSDALRLTRHVRTISWAHCPVSERRVLLLLSDGRILLLELALVGLQALVSTVPTLPRRTCSLPDLQLDSRTPAPICNITSLLTELFPETGPGNTPSKDDKAGGEESHSAMRFVLTGLLPALASPPFIIRMSLPLTTKNWAVYQPILAVGMNCGNIQLFNISGFHLFKELSVHSCTVRGIEWCSLHTFLSFASTNPNSSGLVKNEVFYTDIQNGKLTCIRSNREEESPIEMIKVSHLKFYFVIVFKDQPMEMWETKSMTMLRQMPRHFPKITALEWSTSHLRASKKGKLGEHHSLIGSQLDLSATTPDQPMKSALSESKDPSTFKEHLVFTDPEGLLYHFFVEGNVIKEGSRIPPDGSMTSISYIAWKSETLVLGDVEGNLNMWDLKNKFSKAIPTHKGWVRRMKFAPGRGNMRLIVQYQDGVDIWDAKTVELISAMRTPRDLPKVMDVDWVASDKPVLACGDGTVRIMDMKFKSACSSTEEYSLQDSILCPYFLSPKASLGLRSILQHQKWRQADYVCRPGQPWVDLFEGADSVQQQLDLIAIDIRKYLEDCPFGTAERCLLTARIFGDECELKFWTVALHYLRSHKAYPNGRYAVIKSVGDGNLAQHLEGVEPKVSKEAPDIEWSYIADRPLDSSFDILCDNATFQKLQLEQTLLQGSKRGTGKTQNNHKCAERLILLGQTDRAVQLLLETDADAEEFYTDSLKACLVASVRSSGASQSTIKLVATNLIANGKLSEGTQLLCLIDKGLDACRYLMAYGEWHQATWLAKATLDKDECTEVMLRFVEYLGQPQVNQKSLAALVLLSLGHFHKVLQMSYSQRHFVRALLLVEALQEFQLLPRSNETDELVEAICLEYARFMVQLGNSEAAEYYCNKAGHKGQQFLSEIQGNFSELSS